MAAQIRVGIKDGSLEKRKFIFTINTENYMDPPEIIKEDLCNIFTEIGASFQEL